MRSAGRCLETPVVACSAMVCLFSLQRLWLQRSSFASNNAMVPIMCGFRPGKTGQQLRYCSTLCGQKGYIGDTRYAGTSARKKINYPRNSIILHMSIQLLRFNYFAPYGRHCCPIAQKALLFRPFLKCAKNSFVCTYIHGNSVIREKIDVKRL